jgi:biopolymer transport protein ExbD
VPRLCSASPFPDPDELGPAWRELDRRILALEVGDDRPELARIADIIVQTSVKVPRPPESPAAPVATDRIAVSLTGDRVTVEIAGRTWQIDSAPTPAQLVPIVAAVDKTHGVVIDATGDTQHGTIVALLEALRATGITRIALSTH